MVREFGQGVAAIDSHEHQPQLHEQLHKQVVHVIVYRILNKSRLIDIASHSKKHSKKVADG